MVSFDPARRDVVLRIVYDGLATVGKTANLRALHTAFASRAKGELYAPAENLTGRTLYFDWLELYAGHIDAWPLRCQLLTVPGQFALAERRFHLLSTIDAVVLVCESTPRGVRACHVAWTFLERVLAATGNSDTPIIVQANKQDLPDALPAAEVAARLTSPTRGGAARRAAEVVAACATTGEGVRATFVAALREARERHRLRLADPTLLPPSTDSAEEVYAAMLAAEERSADGAMSEALDAALAALDDP